MLPYAGTGGGIRNHFIQLALLKLDDNRFALVKVQEPNLQVGSMKSPMSSERIKYKEARTPAKPHPPSERSEEFGWSREGRRSICRELVPG